MLKSTRLQVQSSCTFYLVEVPLVLYQVEVLYSGSVLQLCQSELKISQCSIEVVSLGPQVLDDFEVTPTASILPAAV